MITRTAHCPDCDAETPQRVRKYDPDDPDSLLIWVCNLCGESVGFMDPGDPEGKILDKNV
jgi:ribosomal protein L37AE/L43A